MRIAIDQLRYTYSGAQLEERTVLEIPAWHVEPGAHLLLRGISGSGKTTLLNILAGLLPPTQGTVQLGSAYIYRLPEVERDRFRARHIGYVYQTHLLVSTLSAVENVEMPLLFAGGAGGRARRARAASLLQAVGMGAFMHHRPVQLSTGQRLRVAVARALVSKPQLLLADEPTAALDPESSTLVMDLLQARAREVGATLVVASHDPALEQRFDRTYDLRARQLSASAALDAPDAPSAPGAPGAPSAPSANHEGDPACSAAARGL